MIWIVTRHTGAYQWVKEETELGQNTFENFTKVKTFDPTVIQDGDTVVGILPMHLACSVCSAGGRYFAITMDVPKNKRGSDLTVGQMKKFGAKLIEYRVHYGKQ